MLLQIIKILYVIFPSDSETKGEGISARLLAELREEWRPHLKTLTA
jgi:hypothetical protein